jgi:hypothetical protein
MVDATNVNEVVDREQLADPLLRSSNAVCSTLSCAYLIDLAPFLLIHCRELYLDPSLLGKVT